MTHKLKKHYLLFLLYTLCIPFIGNSQQTKKGNLTWEYDIPDTKPTQFQKVQVELKYELSLEKIGDKYKVWAKYTFSPFGTKIWPERGGAYNYKYNGKWYNSDEMWRVDPRTEDGFMNTYGFIPDVKVTMVSMTGYILGNTEAIFFCRVSDTYHVNGTTLGYISNPEDLHAISITPENTKLNYIHVEGTQKLHQRINSLEKKLVQDKNYNELIAKADIEFNNKNFASAKILYQQAHNIYPNNTQLQNKINQTNKEIENLEKQKEQQKETANNSNSQTKNSNSNQENKDANSNTVLENNTKNSTTKGIEEARKLSEETNRLHKEKLDNYFSESREQLKKDTENKLQVLSQSYYANNARRNAEDGLKSNSSFNQKFDNIDDLYTAYYEQINNINQSSIDLIEARVQQNKNNLEYYWGTDTGADRAVGELATGIANIVAQSQAEKERKAAIAKLEKEKEEQLKAIEEERQKKLTQLRNEIFEEFSEGGMPRTKENIIQNELYFFTYRSLNNQVFVSNVFPYASYNDGTWPYKNKVVEESEKITNGSVVLIGYFTSKEEAEKLRETFVTLLPKADVTVNHYNVIGKKGKNDIKNSDEFWNTSTNNNNKTEDFWK